jgi:hypothetical protein
MHSRDSADRPQASSPTDRAAQQPETDVERNLGVLVADVSLLLNRYFNRQARTLELTTPQWQVLSQLYRHDDLTQTELAETLNMAKSPLGKLVDKLEAAGWVRRETDPRDRRIKRIRLTARIDPCALSAVISSPAALRARSGPARPSNGDPRCTTNRRG